MIDLHCHSLYSDGDNTPNQLLLKARELNLKYFSITDHNNCFAYENMQKGIFNGKLITGVEIATSFKGHIIEILGYGMKTDQINIWSRNNNTNKSEYAEVIYSTLTKILKREGAIYTKNINIDNIIGKEDPTGAIKLYMYKDLLKHKENEKIIGKKVLESYSNFNKFGLNNPNSKVFISEYKRFPNINDVIELIHQNGGLCFLAHIYQYDVGNHIEFLNKLVNEVKLDGIETYHSSFTQNQVIEINKYAKELKLYRSGGSDYHGKLKPGIKFGGNVEIPDEIIEPWINRI